MTKAELVAKAVAMGLGNQAGMEAETAKSLESMIAANTDAGLDAPTETKPKSKASDDGNGDDPRTGKKIKVIIELGDGALGKAPFFAGINGYTIQGPRGEELMMDSGFVKYLRSIRDESIEQIIDANGRPTGELRTNTRARFQITEVD